MSARLRAAAERLAVDGNAGIVALAILLVSAGENLFRKFLPKYLEALGAPILAIGLFGSVEDLLDGLYQYPGGWLSDRLGRRRALSIFVALAVAGYTLTRAAPSWPWVFAGLACLMAWSSMASPTLFAVVGDALPKERRPLGFTIQAIVKRIPMVAAPVLGGALIARHGVVGGVRLGLGVSIGCGLLALVVVQRVRLARVADEGSTDLRGVLRTLAPPLKRLLASDVLIRTCEGMVDVFLVLYATSVAGLTAAEYGLLLSVQTITAMLAYLPAARLAGRIGKKPFVVATFTAFAAFPLAVVAARGFPALALAFVVGGLREIGEPSRKALIVDLAAPSLRGRTVGVYYLVRSLAVAPAAFAGALLWRITPALPFLVASAFGFLGTIVFASTVRKEWAG